jgi:hypothetical protein
MTSDELLTKKDLDNFKKELFDMLKPLTSGQVSGQQKWLKNKDVSKLLGISNASIANLRMNGSLPFHKINGTYLYKQSDIDQMMKGSEKKSPKTSKN